MSLYAPPTPITSEVFTRLPDVFRMKNRDAAWVTANKPGHRLDCFLEGPSFDRMGNLYVTDIPYGRVFRIAPDGSWTLVAEYDGWPNGLKIHRDGRIFIADYKRGIVQLNPDSGAVSPVLEGRKSESFKGVNDLFFDNAGLLYFTDQGQTGMHDPTGRVFQLDLETGRLNTLLSNGISPNGLVMDPDQSVLYVAMTRGNAVWRVPVFADGSTSKVGVFVQMAGGVSGADGLAVDEAGSLYVADAGNGCIWVFSRFGEPLHRISAASGGRTVTNMAFGGPDRKMLYFIDSATGSICRSITDSPGQAMFGLHPPR